MAIIDGVEYIRQVKKKKPNENTFLDYVKSEIDIIDKGTLELRIKSQNNGLGNRSNGNNSYFIREKV